jgi:hypothetical protein
MMPGVVITQEAAEAQIGRQVRVGGLVPAQRGIIVAATVIDDGSAVEVTVELPDTA